MSRPFPDDVTDTVVRGQILTSPPRASFTAAAASPAVTDDPLSIFVPPLANSTDPRTLASLAYISPITCAHTGADAATRAAITSRVRAEFMRLRINERNRESRTGNALEKT